MNGGEIAGNTASSSGGGVYEYMGTFRIVTGTIYGTNETNTSLRNIATTGTAVYIRGGTAQRGTFGGTNGAWVSSGTLSTTDNTVKVVNGVLQ